MIKKKYNLFAEIVYQYQGGAQIFQLPDWVGQVKFNYIFGNEKSNLKLSLGVNAKVFSSYALPGYSSEINQFTISNERIQPSYFMVDFLAKTQIKKETQIDIKKIDSVGHIQKYTYTFAKIIKNEYSKPFNYLLIDKGSAEGINKEMAVFNSKGIIGINEKITNNYTRIQSILNKNSKISASIKNGSNYFGPLVWNGKDYNTVQLTDIPRQANVKVGDTIITSGRSTIFPEGILIGSVLKVKNDKSTDNDISIRLFNDMSNLRYVSIVKNLHKIELKNLEDE